MSYIPFEKDRLSTFKSVTLRCFHNLKNRLAEKKSKDGKRILRRGRTLPFTLEQFREHVGNMFNVHWESDCTYCKRVLKLEDFRAEHAHPLARGGSLDLPNIVAACSDCNNIKGKLLPNEFSALMEGLKTFPEPARQDILGRLRGQMRFIRSTKKQEEVQNVG